MSEECNHDCGSCSESCSSREGKKTFFPLNTGSKVRHVVAVVSGKGGVGKSLVTSLLAAAMRRRGYSVGILDADITGPSIPKAFGVSGEVRASEQGAYPLKSRTGIEMMSVNLLLEHDTDPVLWRGPVIANTVKQFWQDVIWQDVDYLFLDMPPGTGDVPLTVFQSLPVEGIVVVTSPQELVSMIVGKAVKMANLMKLPVLGLVENMSYFKCPDCQKKHRIFGESHLDEVAAREHLPVLARIPIEPQLADACDQGKIEDYEGEWLEKAIDVLQKMPQKA